ncbi:pentatricopeptide repeat domain-containing protein 1 [Microdochium nivale]|nr:pentatricopeptide repeat domain-containing protein 1 [Microdochium nivale]
MKAPRTVCLLCRHKLAAAGAHHHQPQSWAPRLAANFTTTAIDSNTQATQHERPPRTAQRAPARSLRRVLASARDDDHRNTVSPGLGRVQQPQSSARVEAIFHNIVAAHDAKDGTAKDGTAQLPQAAQPTGGFNLTLVQDVAKLQDMVDSGDVNLGEAFTFLKTNIYPLVRDSESYIPQIFYTVVSKLVDRAIAAKAADISSTALPSAADIFRVYADLGELKPHRWCFLVGKLVQGLVDNNPDLSIEDYERHLASRDVMLADLVDCWKVLSLPKFSINLDHDSEIDGFWFPRLEKFSVPRNSKSDNFTAALCSMFPQYPPDSLGPPAAALAIATYTLLLDSRRSNPATRRAAVRFLKQIARLITVVRIRDEALQNLMQTTFPGLERYVLEEWPELKRHLRTNVSEVEPSRDWADRSQAGSRGKAQFDARLIGSRLSQAYGRRSGSRNSHEVDKLWQEFVGVEQPISAERSAELQKHPELFNSFINIYMALNNSDKAVQCWNTLRKVGLKPTLLTWNVMLDGCRKARNLHGLTNIWTKLTTSKMPLDIGVWTTYVSGLIDCGNIEGAIKTLEQLTQTYKAAVAAGDTSRVVKPSIEPVNATLAGLIRTNRFPIAEKLIEWSARQGLKPDIFTFNTLLRPLIRQDKQEEVTRLFATMDSLGIKADAATFTVVLDDCLADLDTVEDQIEMVNKVLTQMKSAGLETNLKTYGKMIYLLLLKGDHAKEAVKVVLAHLWSEGHELSPHIYTMLVEHYFSRSPPDLIAVESLLKRRRLLDYDDMDRVFYDRLVKGYSLVGEMRALDIHYKLSEAGYQTTLGSQLELLRMLLNQGRRDEARGLVNTTKRRYEETRQPMAFSQGQGQGSDNGEEESYWKHTFWHVSSEEGLLDTPLPGGAWRR